MNAVISLTTIPSRIAYLRQCVASLIGQGLPVYVWLPRSVERLGAGFDAIPSFLAEMGAHAELVADCGPATKLLPALDRFETIITADDDHIYGSGWASGLLAWAERRPNTALGYRGRRFGKNLNYADSKKIVNPRKAMRVHLLTGVHGALYRRSFFEDAFYDQWKQWPLNDDIVVSGYLWQHGTPLFVVPRSCTIRAMAARSIDPLTASNVRQNLNDAGLRLAYQGWNHAG